MCYFDLILRNFSTSENIVQLTIRGANGINSYRILICFCGEKYFLASISKVYLLSTREPLHFPIKQQPLVSSLVR